MVLLFAALIVAGAVWWAGRTIASALTSARAASSRSRQIALLELFAPALSAVQHDPQALLVWQPLARAARQLSPDEWAALDRAWGGTFPFSREQIQAAHARWTADWLAWERAHDFDYKLKAAAVEQELDASGGSRVVRDRLEAVERGKLELYQRRYEEYVRIAKGLQALI